MGWPPPSDSPTNRPSGERVANQTPSVVRPYADPPCLNRQLNWRLN